MNNLLQVTAVSEVKEDKNEREYKTVTISESPKYATLPNGVQVAIKSKLKSTSVNAYKNNYLDEQDMLWDSVNGSYVEGSLVSRNVTPYSITSTRNNVETTRTVTSASVPVFADATSATFETEVARAFKQAANVGKDEPLRFTLVDADGVVASDWMKEVAEVEVSEAITDELG
jgi:hypothetical protein|tara:strand:- start:1632 stop:2150 length:519 start_codon:yes stop_codon:yes gene_type:complete